MYAELYWPVIGDRIPADHNYRLYSALIDQINELKTFDWQLGTITGIPDRKGWLKLGCESRLMVRSPFEHLVRLADLDGKVIRIGQSLIQLGESVGQAVEPQNSLTSRFVTIKVQNDPRVDPFLFGVSLGKQLQKLGIESMPKIGDRKAIRIKDRSIVGYSLAFEGLSPEESLTLQSRGVGGRRKIGGGVFLSGG